MQLVRLAVLITATTVQAAPQGYTFPNQLLHAE
jgi:hypothetical protein